MGGIVAARGALPWVGWDRLGLLLVAVLEATFLAGFAAVRPRCARILVGVGQHQLAPARLRQRAVVVVKEPRLGRPQCRVVHAREVGVQRRFAKKAAGRKRGVLPVAGQHPSFPSLGVGQLALDRLDGLDRGRAQESQAGRPDPHQPADEPGEADQSGR